MVYPSNDWLSAAHALLRPLSHNQNRFVGAPTALPNGRSSWGDLAQESMKHAGTLQVDVPTASFSIRLVMVNRRWRNKTLGTGTGDEHIL